MNIKMRLLFVLTIFLWIKVKCEENIVVEIANGKVLGKKLKTLFDDKEFFSFEGVPYAKPPLKELRFEPPVKKSSWIDTYDARSAKKPCPQYSHSYRRAGAGPYGVEDCLHIDIYTPEITGSKPVVVLIQNFYFLQTYNISKTYRPDFFVEEDVIVVVPSYRIGVYGFLSLENDLLPGNNGLKDVILSLQWIQENIVYFGGDPSQVTLLGSLDGGTLVDILLHSRKADGLFSKATIQSGTSWKSIVFSQHAKQDAYTLAEKLDRIVISDSNVLKDFRKMKTYELLGKEYHVAHQDFSREHQTGLMSFGPVVEHNHTDAVVTSLPEKDKTPIKVPLMIGYNSEEGLEAARMYLQEPRYLSYIEKDMLLYMPLRGLSFNMYSRSYLEAVNDIKDYYFNGKVKVSQPTEYLRYIGDTLISYPVDFTVKQYAQSSESPIYYYQFDYDGKFNFEKTNLVEVFTVLNETWGTASMDEMCYLFYCPPLKKFYIKAYEGNTEDYQVLKQMVKLWSNFIKFGNPTPNLEEGNLEWTPTSSEVHNYLHISKETSMKTNPHADRFQFWDSFIEKYSKMAINGVVQDVKDEL